MPKLTSDTAKKVEEAEALDFEALPEDIYTAVLADVENKEGKNGPYWKWTFKITTDGYDGRQQWTNTSLSEKALWKLQEMFEAFGVPADTNTDDLIGQGVKLMVVQELIGEGKRKGQMGNSIDKVLPLHSADADGATKTGSKSKASKADDVAPLF